MKINDIKQLKENLKTVFALEYFGVHIEEVREEKNLKLLYYFSVPEKSKIKSIIPNNNQINTSDGLIELAKESITEMIIESHKHEFDDNEEYEEFYNDVKNNISDYVLFFAKVREGEIWTEEMGKDAIQKITDEIKNNSYKQV